MSTIHFSLITFGTPDFDVNLSLRDEILRKPLNMSFTTEQIAEEWDSFHIGAYSQEILLGSLIIKPVDRHLVKMRQVAVAGNLQKKGIGSQLVKFSEAFARSKGFKRIELHARLTAVPFYTKLLYTIDGPLFKEVGLDHHKMYLDL